MRRFEIVNGKRRNMEPCAVFVWDDDSISFSIDIDESPTEKMPLCCSSHFFAHGTAPYRGCVGRAMGWRAYCSVGRAEVLRPNGLQFYDSVLLLIAGEGECAQDDFFIKR